VLAEGTHRERGDLVTNLFNGRNKNTFPNSFYYGQNFQGLDPGKKCWQKGPTESGEIWRQITPLMEDH
jgi:hypothetical protein